MRIFQNLQLEYIKHRYIAYAFSGFLVLASLALIFTKGLQYGIDFKGGKEFVITTETVLLVPDVRTQLTSTLGSQPEVKRFGSEKDLLVRTDSDLDLNPLQQAIVSSLNGAFEGANVQIIKTDIVGPRFAEDLKIGALNSIGFSIFVIFIYILIRFRSWTFSAGAVAALLHDVIVTLGIFTALNGVLPFSMEIDQSLIAAFLTIVGYSLNDTVVIFDRIRENKLIFKTEALDKLVNRSINDTLSRTVITSATTLFVVFVLFIFGGEVLKGLSFALIVGIVSGTYSTVFVSSALYHDLNVKPKKS